MKKKVFIGIDVLLILLSITPIGLLIYDCVNKAINGILPWGDGYGLDYGNRIYGLEAFRYELISDNGDATVLSSNFDDKTVASPLSPLLILSREKSLAHILYSYDIAERIRAWKIFSFS